MKTAIRLAAGLFVCALPLPFFTVLNLTPSIPVGLYIKTSSPRAPYTIFCLDPKSASVLRAHGVTSKGTCPSGSEPVIKPLIRATPTNPVTLTEEGFYYRGKLLPNTAPKTRALDGGVLLHWQPGTYTDGLFAISTYNADSYDSRYFGPINATSIISRARPLLTF